MNKDEMKDRISLALKDPILQQGFEIICKDLETVKRKLKTETELSKRLGVAYREYEQLTKEQDEHLADLEKENAEAKEIIREYSKWECEYCDYKRNPDYVTIHCSQCQKYPFHKKAEAFLNSEVEK